MRLLLVISFLVCLGCDDPTSWDKGGHPACFGCELEYTQWYKDFDGVGTWEWLFKESSYLAGKKGLLNPIQGEWRVDGDHLIIADESCSLHGKQDEGVYAYQVYQSELALSLVSDPCTPRATSVPGIWRSTIQPVHP